MAQLHERAVLKCGTGNDLAPSAQLQHVLIVDDLQDDFFDSGHRLFIPYVPAAGTDIVRQASFVVAYLVELPLTLRQPVRCPSASLGGKFAASRAVYRRD